METTLVCRGYIGISSSAPGHATGPSRGKIWSGNGWHTLWGVGGGLGIKVQGVGFRVWGRDHIMTITGIRSPHDIFRKASAMNMEDPIWKFKG